jgi:hypothetical protein
VEISLANVRQKLVALVLCVKGFLFSIEYQGSVKYFEEAAGLDAPSELNFVSALIADLAAPN